MGWSLGKSLGKIGDWTIGAISKGGKKAISGFVDSIIGLPEEGRKYITSELEKATKAVGKGAEKAVNKGIDIGKNIADSSMGAVKSVAKGDISSALKYAGNIASGGAVDLTGRRKGILNVNTDKYIAKMMGADLGASGTGSLTALETVTKTKQRKGLIGQLRQGKGVGGGSYTETVKYPLGGTAGKTGK